MERERRRKEENGGKRFGRGRCDGPRRGTDASPGLLTPLTSPPRGPRTPTRPHTLTPCPSPEKSPSSPAPPRASASACCARWQGRAQVKREERREGCGFGPRGLRVRTLQSPARDNATLQLGPCGGCASSPRRNRAVLSPQAPTGTITGRGTHSLTRARLNPVPSLGVSAAAAARLTPRSLLLF